MTKYTRKQQVFDHVARHLIRQGGQALTADGNCVYRTEKGERCAVGCLIQKRHYNPRIEGLEVADSEVRHALRRSGVRTTNQILDLLESLQALHDDVCTKSPLEFRKEMRRSLADVASWAKLNTKVLGRATS